MNQVTTIGLDLAKNVFQVHGVDASPWTGTRPVPAGPRHSRTAQNAKWRMPPSTWITSPVM